MNIERSTSNIELLILDILIYVFVLNTSFLLSDLFFFIHSMFKVRCSMLDVHKYLFINYLINKLALIGLTPWATIATLLLGTLKILQKFLFFM